MNVLKLKSKILENGLKQKNIANIMKMSLSTFNAKLNDRSNFDIKEASVLSNILKLSKEEIMNIFFE